MTRESDFSRVIRDGCTRYGLVSSPGMLSLFRRYHELLKEWNTRVNLVSRRDLERFAEYHILDALKVASVFDFSGVHSMMDFGSGSGVPGIPLAIAFHGIDTLLLEPRVKRFAFLEAACASLPLPNVRVKHSRIESLDRSRDGSFDVVITRATVTLSEYFALASPFLSERGALIAIKGDALDNELSMLLTVLDTAVFSLTTATPIHVDNVRTGTVVIVSRR